MLVPTSLLFLVFSFLNILNWWDSPLSYVVQELVRYRQDFLSPDFLSLFSLGMIWPSQIILYVSFIDIFGGGLFGKVGDEGLT